MSKLKLRKDMTPSQSAGYNRAKQQEKELAKRYSGWTTPASGSRAQKGDVRKACGGIIRIEAKCTGKKSFSVTRDMLDAIESAALPNNELPAIIIEFIDERGNPEKEIAVVPTYVLDMLYEQ